MGEKVDPVEEYRVAVGACFVSDLDTAATDARVGIAGMGARPFG
jgi:hypothetical protein